MEQKIRKLYDEVFDEYGNIKNCGREKCKTLIECVSSLTDKNVGDTRTGFINISEMKEACKEIFAE